MADLVIHPHTFIRISKKTSTYTAGNGASETWAPLTRICHGVVSDAFPVEWRGAFGADMISAAAQNIRQMATIRMSYHPDVWEALRTREVRVHLVEEGPKAHPFVVYGDADNVGMQNQVLEFKVHRLEGK